MKCFYQEQEKEKTTTKATTAQTKSETEAGVDATNGVCPRLLSVECSRHTLSKIS